MFTAYLSNLSTKTHSANTNIGFDKLKNARFPCQFHLNLEQNIFDCAPMKRVLELGAAPVKLDGWLVLAAWTRAWR
jgi:hypothetical protein